MYSAATTGPARPNVAARVEAPFLPAVVVAGAWLPVAVGPEDVVVLGAVPDLVTLKFSDWVTMPVLVAVVPRKRIWYLSPGAATKLLKEYLPSAVLTRSLMTVCFGPAEDELSTSTMEKLEGSVDTLVHSIVLVWEKSQASLALGAVMVRAGRRALLVPRFEG